MEHTLPSSQAMPPGAHGRCLRLATGEYLVLCFPRRLSTAAAKLTESERAIVQAVLQGQSNARIAEARGRSLRTVANQVASVFRKLGVRSRVELAYVLAAQPQAS